MNIAIVGLIIMGLTIILFVLDILPSATVAMLGCIAMAAFGVCSVEQIMYGFSGSIIMLVFGMQLFGEAIFSSGAAALIGNLAVKLSANRERRFLVISCIISAVLSAFLTNTAVIIMMIAICAGVVCSSENMKMKNLSIPIAVAAIFGGQCTLVGSTTQLTASGILQNLTGESFSIFSLAYFGIPATIFIILFMAFIGYPMGKRIWGKTEGTCEAITASAQIDFGKYDKKKILILSGIFLFMMVFFLTGWLDSGVTAMIAGIACIVSGCVSQKEAFRKLDWNVLIWLSCCLGLGNALNVSGGSKIIGSALMSLFGSQESAFLLFAAMVLLSMLLSQVMSNMTTILILLPATLSMIIPMGLNPYIFTYGMNFGAALTFLTPLASGHIGFTLTSGYHFKDYLKYGLIPSICVYLMIIFLCPLFFPLVL